ncbi:hypothetical protein DSO57_1035767 [Entomophthora muscae]|uniref:Uncharacterized protein n=1 Tax=Entomophthora muscae TaxID=34485 RepID=A0ACC2SZF4_9FUNG|nr:hypothetical protein DSO57_1035767 [Entomophthora muscae]
MAYSTTHLHLNNVDGTYHLDVSWLLGKNFDRLQVLTIYRLTQPFRDDFEFPELRCFKVKFISRHNLEKVIQASPLLATVGWESLMAEYSRIQIKSYEDPHPRCVNEKGSMSSVFDQNA